MAIEVLTRADIKNLSVVSQGQLEIIDWWLYDTLTVAQGGTATSFRFFQQAIGSTIGGSPITLEQTNMEIPGQLPAGYKFICQKMVFQPIQKTDLKVDSVKDAFAVSHRGHAQFFIGTRPYMQLPVKELIGGTFNGFAAGGTEVAYASPRTIVNGEFEYSPAIPANFSFSLVVDYPVAPVLVADIAIRAMMVGKLVRPKQG